MKILILTQYDEHGASSQVRVYQFLSYFQNAFDSVEIRPLIKHRAADVFRGMSQFSNIFRKISTLAFIAKCYLSRVKDILDSRHYDGVFLQKDVLPFGLGRLLFALQKNVVFEFDDPIWLPHVSMGGDSWLGRTLVRYRKHCLDYVLKRAKFVICDNPKIKEYVSQFNQEVVVLTSPIDASRFRIEDRKVSHTLLWIGSPGTSYLISELLPRIEELKTVFSDLRLINIGGLPLKSEHIEVENHEWSFEAVRECASRSGVGLAPGELSFFNQYKYAFKIWIYGALGLPTLASNTGLNPDTVIENVTGSLYDSSDDFAMKASRLLTSTEINLKMGEAARRWVSDHYDLSVMGPKMVEALTYGLTQKLPKGGPISNE